MQYLYKDSNIIFTQFSKATSIFTVRKWKPKTDSKEESKDVNLIKGEVKISEKEIELSTYDKIIKGDRKGIKVLHEDEKLIAFEEINPVS